MTADSPADFKADEAVSQVASFRQRVLQEDSELKESISHQGAFGNSIDYLKNHFGASENHRPLAGVGEFFKWGWSYVLNHDLGSQSAAKQIRQTERVLSAAERAAERGDGQTYGRLISWIADTSDGRLGELDVRGAAARYEQSQRRGVGLASDLVSVGMAALSRKYSYLTKLAIPKLTEEGLQRVKFITPVIGGMIGKNLGKTFDSTYANLFDDTTTGAFIGMTVPVGRLLAKRTEATIIAKSWGTPSRAFSLSNAADSTINGGTLAAVSAYENALAEDSTRGEALISGIKHAPVGMVFGGAIGYGLARLNGYLRIPRADNPSTKVAITSLTSREPGIASKATAQMASFFRRFLAAEKASANALATKISMGSNVPDPDKDLAPSEK